MTTIIVRKNVAIVTHRGQILTYVDFIGREKKCWDCGGNRQILLKHCIENGKMIEFKECCDK